MQLPGDADPFGRNGRPVPFFGLRSLGLQRARLTAALHRQPDQPRGCHEQHENRAAPGEPVQQPKPERAPRIAARVLVCVRRAVSVAVKMEMGAVVVRVHVQVPAAARIT